MERNPRPELEIRSAEGNDRDGSGFCKLSNSLYSRKVNSAYYSWQFFQGPFPCGLSVATVRDEPLIGTYGLHLKSAQSEKVTVGWSIDIMVAPHWRKQGVFRALEAFAERQAMSHGASAICVMANERADVAHVQGLGWCRVNTFMTFQGRSERELEGGPSRLTFSRFEDFEMCRDLLGRTGLRIRGYDGSFLFSNRRSVEYLNWRFSQNPRYDYDLFAANRGDEVFGYVVLKVFRDPVSGQCFGDIVDLQWIEDDPERLTEMLHFALDQFRAHAVPQVAIWLQTNTILDEVGRKSGFVPTNLRRYFCCKVLNEQYRFLEDPNRWFITMADAEIY